MFRIGCVSPWPLLLDFGSIWKVHPKFDSCGA